MPDNDAKVRAFVTDALKRNKGLTEREVKKAIGRAFKRDPKGISAGVIREVRKNLGIDRPGAVAYVRNLLGKNPTLEAKRVIAEVSEKFGIRFGAPDISRLRPPNARRSRLAKRGHKFAGISRGHRAGAITVTYEGRGVPEDLAMFFRALAE